MTVYIKSGGAWRACANGSLRIKNGGIWRQANYCYIKSGGVWRDSGYRGYPNVPAGNMWVHDWTSWGFGHIQVAWNYSTGGAPATSYDVEMLNSANQVIATEYGSTDNIAGFNVGEDYQVKFRVRASSAAGLKSDWTYLEGLRVKMGHTEQGYTQSEPRTREWWSGEVPVNLWNGSSAGPQVPSSVEVDGIYVNLSATWSVAYLSPGSGSQRDIYIIKVGQIYNGVLTLANPSNGWLRAATGNGGNSGWGLYATGAGFSQYGDGGYRVVGNLNVHGTETYYVNVYYKTRDYASNSYW